MRIIVPQGTAIAIDRSDVLLTCDITATVVCVNDSEIVFSAEIPALLPDVIAQFNEREGYAPGTFAIAF